MSQQAEAEDLSVNPGPSTSTPDSPIEKKRLRMISESGMREPDTSKPDDSELENRVSRLEFLPRSSFIQDVKDEEDEDEFLESDSSGPTIEVDEEESDVENEDDVDAQVENLVEIPEENHTLPKVKFLYFTLFKDKMTEAENIDHKETITLQGSWILVNHVEEAEEATALDKTKTEEKEDKDSDVESDGISVISEPQFLDSNSNTDDEIPVKKESDSSSDETNSSKWTFVDDAATNEEPSNKFYLNCMQEPVQELSEQELGSIHSDLESDGVSIISETEDEAVEETRIINENGSDWYESNIFFFNVFILSTVVFALIAICLSAYFTNSRENVSVFDEKTIKAFKKLDIEDPMVYCRDKHEHDGICSEINAKCRKCLWKVEKSLRQKKFYEEQDNGTEHEKFLKKKERFLKRKEKFLKQKEHELVKVEKILKKHKFKLGNNPELDIEKNLKVIERKKWDRHEYNLKKFNKKTFAEIERKSSNGNNKKNHKIKKDDIRNMKLKLKDDSKTIYRLYKANKINKTSSTNWYNELHKGRYRARKSEHESEWVFDRATVRDQRRNKALWYFNWMGHRETNRYKKFSH